MSIALSVPGLTVNNDPIAIVPGTFSFKGGQGETTVRAASTGGGGITTVHTVDAETKIGVMKWEMYVTDDNVTLINTWKKNTAENFISAQQEGTDPYSMSNASMINDPDFKASTDGTVEVEFHGDPLSEN